jgi:hypothetical protein
MLTDFVLAGDEQADPEADPEDLKGASCVRNTVMQQYLQQILNCAYHPCDEVALASLKLVSYICERGQVSLFVCLFVCVCVCVGARVLYTSAHLSCVSGAVHI